MGQRAKISDVEVLKQLKVALTKFLEEAGTTIAGVDSEVQRVGQWLTLERPAYWKHELRRREDKVQAAKAAIAAKQLARAPEPVSVAEERQILARCQRKLDDGAQRAAAVKRWAPVWDREAQLYKSSCSGLTETMERDVPQGIARIERMVAALEAYLRVRDIETADDLASGLDAIAVEDDGLGWGGRAHRYSHLRDGAPGWEARGELSVMAVNGLRWAGGEVAEADLEQVKRLSLWEGRPGEEDRVVLAWRTVEVSSWVAVRLGEGGAGAAGDSGWYLGPTDRPEATGGLRATTVGSLVAALPWMGGLLGLAPGSMVVVNGGSVAAVLDETDRDAWATGH